MDNSDKHPSVAFVSGDSVTVNGNEGYSVDRRHLGVFRQSQFATPVANRLLCEGNGRVETTRNSFGLKGQEQTGHST